MEFPEDFERGLWIPSTPAKPIPTTRPLPVSGSSWLESVDVTRGTGRPWSAVNRGPATALALGDGELKGKVTDDDGLRPAQMPFGMLSEAAEHGDVSRYMGFRPLMAAARATGGSSVPLNAEASNWNRSALNGGIFLPPSRGTQNSRLLSPLVPELQLKFPVHPTPPNLNSSPEINRTCRVVSEALTSPASPSTVEKCQHDGLYDLLCCEMIDLVSETGSCQDDVKQQNERNHAEVNTSEVMPAQQAEGENQGADLNRTPRQKPKRKKHRPKVIRERKPAGKLKPETSKSATPLTTKTRQNPFGKRKYMRKKNDPIPQENPTSTPVDVIDPDIPSWSKSVRRSLNFDLLDASLRSAPISQIASETRAHLTSTVKFSGGVGFEINDRLRRLENGNVRTPQTPNQPSQPSRLEMESMKAKFQGDFRRMVNKLGPSLESEKTLGENVKKLAKKNIGLGIAGDSESDLVDDRSQGDPSRTLDLLLKGTKRDHSNLVDDACVLTRTGDMYGCNDTGSTDTCVDEIQKKRRIENEQKATTFNSSTVLTYTPQTGWRTFDARNGVSTFADSQSWMAHEKRQAWECMLMSNQAEKEKNNKFHAHTTTSTCAVADRNKESILARASDHYQKEHYQPSTPQKAPEQGRGLGNATDGHQARTKILTGGQPKSRGRKMKDQVHLVNSTSHTSQIEHAAAAAAYKTASLATELAPQNLFAASVPLRSSPVREHQNNRGSASPRFMAGTVVSYCDPVDDLTQKREHLKINGGDLVVTGEPTNAVVPYAGGGMMVSFQGSFDVIKKRKPRAKVDLDPESNRVWKLLMGMETSEAEEGTKANKEKWWEEERRVFRGRVDSFIARMHLIQGDRRFSRWKGSVVDSVIGVFLTQNVSDHLSSSAFMSLAARFPLQSNGNKNNPRVEIISRPLPANDSAICQGKALKQEMCDCNSQRINDSEEKENKETASNNESLESNYSLRINDEERSEDNSKENGCGSCARELGVDSESPDSASVTAVTVTSCNSAIEGEDRRTVEDVVLSQNSVVSSQSSSEFINQTGYQERLTPLLNFEADALLGGGNSSGNSFMDLMQMVGNGKISSAEYAYQNDWSAHLQSCNVPASVDGLGASTYSSNSDVNPLQHDFTGFSCAPSYHHENLSNSRFMGLENANVIRGQGYQSNSTFSSLKINETGINELMGRQYRCSTGTLIDSTDQNKILAPKISCHADSCMPISKKTIETVAFAGLGDCVEKRCCQSEASSGKIIFDTCAHQEDVNTVKYPHKKCEVLQVESTQESVGSQFQNLYCGSQTCTNFHIDNQRKSFDSTKRAESNFRNGACTSEKVLTEIVNKALKGKKVKPKNGKSSYDWDSLRKQSCENGVQRERSKDTMDSLDYEALRNADVNEISHTIRDRGMNNVLAERIKDFLNRLVNDHGSVDLEWLRDVPPDQAKDYLLSIRGLGLKSVECVRLLTLRHLAFPVDTNVGRICVRLGWVPLQPLPESLQLHLLEMYPVLETIQKYLWPRLCQLDQLTLYELHYQLITFGKVFCTKSKPNCNACPMRGECKHFASAFASSRLVLPGPEEKGLVRSGHPSSFENGHSLFHNPTPILQLEGCTLSFEQAVPRNCEPIIEEPATPEPELECTETSEIDIEDAFYNDPDEIPTIKLDFEEFTTNLQSYIQEKNMWLQDGDMSKALVALTPEAASIPMPKLKNVNRLRTEHLVYELQDSHPLLEGMDKRELDDPCPYLLAIWTPGETAQSTEPPTACCNSHDTGKFCDNRMCFSCNSIREARAQTVRGTLLIPCRTANRGSFPLNGTYFQVNEVFADHFSSCNPIDVPRNYIWNVPRRTVYFGTSIPSIFKGLTTEGIQHCFWKGFVCVRGFDRVTRAPKPLFTRLHFSAGKSTRNKRTVPAAAGNQE